MNAGALLRLLVRPAPRAGGCGSCRHFDPDPHRIEAAMPGLTALSSALGSVRADDGLCGLHDRLTRARAGCDRHAPPARDASATSLD